ncbi:MAG: hypothetical protein QOE11_3595 [Solirubrobacteraceae bacterium]|jgi:hypothetical protein|nr:hypothetical protein [Solirubrobacteraceae bacterium]
MDRQLQQTWERTVQRKNDEAREASEQPAEHTPGA